MEIDFRALAILVKVDRERTGLKQGPYGALLGLMPGQVSELERAAMRKLSVGVRDILVKRFGALPTGPAPAADEDEMVARMREGIDRIVARTVAEKIAESDKRVEFLEQEMEKLRRDFGIDEAGQRHKKRSAARQAVARR